MPGSVKNHIQFWFSIGTSQFISVLIDEGYRIPFYSTPPPSFLRNNKSALAHPSFVDEASELLLTYRFFERDVIPCNGESLVRFHPVLREVREEAFDFASRIH